MNLTIVIPFWNGHDTIQRLLDSLPPLPVVVVDDHSDEPLHLNRENVIVVRPQEKGYFTGAVNVGLKRTETDVLVLNQDAWFEDNRFFGLLTRRREKYDVIGERISGQNPKHPAGYIHGTCMYMSREAIETVGLMDEVTYPLWGSTCEWQMRAARKGFNVLPLADVPGFRHERKRGVGRAIREMVKREPQNKETFFRTPPEISVVITAYNYGRYLHDAVNSLVGGPTSLGDHPGQTFQSFEVIIVDDGSTDDTPQIGKALADPFKCIRYIRQNNAGSPVAANTGIEAAYGRFIAMLDADDMMLPDRLEQMRLSQLAHPHSVICDDMFLFEDGEYRMNDKGERVKWVMPTYDLERILYKNGMHKGLMFPKQAWEEVGGYPAIMNNGREDWAFNVALGLKGWCGVRLPRAGYLYRREGQNRTLVNTTPAHRQRFMAKLKTLYPRAYQGEMPMAARTCCGGRSASRSTQRKRTLNKQKQNGGPRTMAEEPGAEGMVLIEYLGDEMAKITYTGHETNRRYVFGGDRKRGYVDARDVNGFLGIWEDDRRMFRRVEQQEQVDPQPEEHVPTTEVDPDEDEEDVGDAGDEPVEPVEPSDWDIPALVTEKTAADLIDLIDQGAFSPSQLQAIRDQDSRVTVQRAASSCLEEEAA